MSHQPKHTKLVRKLPPSRLGVWRDIIKNLPPASEGGLRIMATLMPNGPKSARIGLYSAAYRLGIEIRTYLVAGGGLVVCRKEES